MNARRLTLMGIVALAALARLLPHPPNMTPIAAMALFGGAYFCSRKTAYLVPLAAMLLSDIVLGCTVYGTALFHSQPVVYACIAATVVLGRLIRERRSAANVAFAALAGSVLFFVVTNFACWAFDALYPTTWAGLVSCYVAAIPFFRNTLFGDLTYTAALFGGFAILEQCVPSLRERQRVAVES